MMRDDLSRAAPRWRKHRSERNLVGLMAAIFATGPVLLVVLAVWIVIAVVRFLIGTE